MPTIDNVSLRDVVTATLRLAAKGERLTHLGVCPMSEELIRAPIELGMEHDFPVLFVASRNQISEDSGGGYVMGMDQGRFVDTIAEIEEETAKKTGSSRPYLRYVSVDHCGPWYKEREKSLGEAEALTSVKKTLLACIGAGYAGIHIDCSFSPPADVEMNAEKMVRMTADLFEHAERERVRLGKAAVSYEIGTEETAGAGVSAEHFRESINAMAKELETRSLPLPAFVVGRTGAKIEMLENVGGFDYTSASSLPAIAGDFGIGFKEHNADYLSDPILSVHPEYGVTGANVGPSFAAAQTSALLELARLEQECVGEGRSDLYRVMSDAALRLAPWHKWLRKGDRWTLEDLNEDPFKKLAATLVSGHYVYYEDEVARAIEALYGNLRDCGAVEDPQGYVMQAVKGAIMRYVDAFRLRGSTETILRAL